jgi:hypothetical protein
LLENVINFIRKWYENPPLKGMKKPPFKGSVGMNFTQNYARFIPLQFILWDGFHLIKGENNHLLKQLNFINFLGGFSEWRTSSFSSTLWSDFHPLIEYISPIIL